MLVWKITENLREPYGEDWEYLSRLMLTDKVHPDRKKGFIMARMALIQCLKETGIEAKPRDLEMTSHSLLKKFPEFTVSLSHTKSCGAAILGQRSEYKSLGIDIEQETRPVKDMIIERIAHPKDQSLRNIELWCLKEAVFKTIMNTGMFEHPIEFSEILISQNEWSHSPSNLSGKWELDVINSNVCARSILLS